MNEKKGHTRDRERTGRMTQVIKVAERVGGSHDEVAGAESRGHRDPVTTRRWRVSTASFISPFLLEGKWRAQLHSGAQPPVSFI